MKHTTLSVFDHVGGKVCDQYDSDFKSPGQAHTICLTTEINGWKELSFTLPYMADSESNFRWEYIQNEYRLRLKRGTYEDWFTITRPKRGKSSGQISGNVVCYHISSVLKTKNLYLQFDDANGIDTCENLVTKALSGTSWKLGTCDNFYESDGKTEKVRSLSSTGKVGSYQLITNICGLFNAYPVYNGDTLTVDIHALSNKLPQEEMIVGHNLTALSVDPDSDSIVTRLYVEGEYGDDGYVGIDDVNPTGLSYLLNFDYYKEIGLFSASHQAALDKYLADISAVNRQINSLASEIISLENELNTIWGQPEFVYYVGGVPFYFTEGLSDDEKRLSHDDEVYILLSNGTYSVEVYDGDTRNDIVKFVTKSSYAMGSKEVAIDAKEKTIESLEKDLNSADEEDKPAINEKIQALRNEITSLYTGTTESEGLYSLMRRASETVKLLKAAKDNLSMRQLEQSKIESIFTVEMGDLLKDGYWSNKNYIGGQEEFLYADALEMSAELAKPTVSYTISLVQASDIWGEVETEFLINSKVRIYDPELQVNDIVFVTKTVEYLDDESKGSVEISNDDLSIVGKSFDSILGRITQQADMIDQKTSLIDRANSIGKDGTISVVNLEGQIDLLKNKLISSTSNWYTDDNGNIIFLSVNGRSAMMLSGEGFMIANGKTDDGDWNWRTFGTGEGFTADLITAGTISADRIRTGSIGISKLSSDLAHTIQQTEILMEPGKITSIVRSSEEYQSDLNGLVAGQRAAIYRQTQDPREDASLIIYSGDIWIKPAANENYSDESYIWDGTEWVPLVDNEYISELGSWLEQTDEHIEAAVTKKMGDYATTTDMQAAIKETAESINLSVKETYATKGDLGAVTGADSDIVKRQNAAEQKMTPESIVSTVTSSNEFTTQYATREQTATAISQAVSEVDGNISKLEQTVEGINAQVQDNRGDIASQAVESDTISARVTSNEKEIGQQKQTADGFETKIADAEGNISRLEQDAEQFKASVGQDIIAQTSDATGQQMTLSFDRGGSVEVGYETLTCYVHVWKNGEEVTDLIPRGAFSWQRSSGDSSGDSAWNATHKSTKTIALTRDEIGKSCQIKCTLNAKGYYGYFDIVDGALVIIRPDDGIDDKFELRGEDLYGDESYDMDEDGYVYKTGVPGQMSVSSTVFDHTVLETSHILIKNNKVEIRSGGDIDIKAGGSINMESGADLNVSSGADVNIHAGGHINLEAGGTFTTASKNFSVDANGNVEMTGKVTAGEGGIGGWEIKPGNLQSGNAGSHVRLSTEDATYAMWAGADNAESAPFRIARDGTAYLTKLYVTDSEGVAQDKPVDLRTSYWKVDSAYAHAVKSMTVANNTLTITLNNGTSINFKKAATGSLVASGNGTDNFTISFIDEYNGPGTGTVIDSEYVNLSLSDAPYNALSSVRASFGNQIYGSISVGGVYTAGHSAGETVGYDSGFDEGYRLGTGDGYEDGALDGYDTGFARGEVQGWNDCRSSASRQQVLINYYTAGETLYDRDGNVATGPWYKGTEAYRYSLPAAKQ